MKTLVNTSSFTGNRFTNNISFETAFPDPDILYYLYSIKVFLLSKLEVESLTVSEIKGAPCTRRAHFYSRVHDFQRCAPGVCTFLELSIIAVYREGAWSKFRVHRFRGHAPCECTK